MCALIGKPVCGGRVCVGGGGRAFYYIYSSKGQSCEGAELVSVVVAENIHPACMFEEDAGGREAGAPSDLKMPWENGRAAGERASSMCV